MADEPVSGATAGIVGTGEFDAAVPAKGDTFVGIAGAALTPRFPIS
jgi:hypothetical protein